MAKVLVDQDQLNQLGIIVDEDKKKVDTIFSLVGDLKQQIADLQAATPDTFDLAPLLGKVNAVDDELGTMIPVAPTPPDAPTATTDARGGIDPADATPPMPAIGDTVTIPGVDGPQKVTGVGPDGTLTVEPVTESAG